MHTDTLTWDDPVALCLMLGFLALVLLAFGARHFALGNRIARAMSVVPRDAIARAEEGAVVRVVGRLRVGDEKIVAPLSGRVCAHYFVVVEQQVEREGSVSWQHLASESRGCDFSIEDGSGTARVPLASRLASMVLDRHWQQGVLHASGEAQRALLERLRPDDHRALGGRVLRYQEGVLEAGEEVAAVGRARWEQIVGGGTGYREAHSRRLVLEPTEDGHRYASDAPELRA